MREGYLYSTTSGGVVHLIVEVVSADCRLPDQPNGITACGQKVDPCCTTSEFRGHAGVDYRGEWLTCKKCRKRLD